LLYKRADAIFGLWVQRLTEFDTHLRELPGSSRISNRIPVFIAKSIPDFHLPIGARLKNNFKTAGPDGTLNQEPIFK
jgi:hypothetical protein